MLAEFSFRNRWIIVGAVASACLAAFLWAKSGRVDTSRSQDRGAQNRLNASPEKDSTIAISAKVCHASNSEDVGAASKPYGVNPLSDLGFRVFFRSVSVASAERRSILFAPDFQRDGLHSCRNDREWIADEIHGPVVQEYDLTTMASRRSPNLAM